MSTPVAKPVLALDLPLALDGVEKTTEAIKHLHGPDTFLKQYGPKAVVFTPGKICACGACDAFIRRVAELDLAEYTEQVHTCTNCTSTECPAAADHNDPCTHSIPGENA